MQKPRSLKTWMTKMIGGFDTFPSWRHLDDLEHLERHVGAPFPFPIVAKCGEGERELEENGCGEKRGGRKNTWYRARSGARANFEARRRPRLKIPDRHVFAAYKSTTFQRSRCSAFVVKARTCVTIDGFSPTTN